MKGIRRRGSSFQANIMVNGVRRTATLPTRKEAEEWRVDARRALVAEAASPVGWTLAEAFDKTMSVTWGGTRGEASAVINGRAALDHFGPEALLSTIDVAALDGYVAALQAKGNSDGTINRKLAALSKIMTVALDRGALDRKPKFPRRREAKGRVRFLSDREEADLLHILRQWGRDLEADLVTVLVDTGLRVGEALRLSNQDVDHQRRLVTVWENKADLPRTVPLTTRAAAVLAARAREHGPLFPITKHQFRHTWERARGHMGLLDDQQFVPHALRHTCASRLVQRGVPIKMVQEWLGHRTLTVTMRYAHLSPANLLDAVKVLEPS